MAIVNLIGWNKVSVPSTHSINDIFHWLESKDLKIGEDFRFGGQKDEKIQFSFKEKQAAMMFKLTFGGE